MIPHRLRGVVRTFRLAALVGIVGFALLLAAVIVASSNFGACGASTLQAAEASCRSGARLLVAAYVALSIALVLGAISLTLLWRERRERRRHR